MPICQIKTNFRMSDSERKIFADTVADRLSLLLEKPLPAVMVMISTEDMYMNHSDDTVVFAEFRYVKDFSSPEEKAEFLGMFADQMLEIFQQFTKVDPYRIYMQFTEMPRDGAWRYIKKGNS